MRASSRRPCPLEWAKQEIGASRNDARQKADCKNPMKTELSTFARTPFRVWRGARTAAWLATVALGAWSAFVSNAAVIDDFEDGIKFLKGGGGTNYFIWDVAGGQLVVSNPSPVPSPPNNALFTYDSVYWPVQGFAGSLDGGRTLELRMDLVQASADDLFLALMCGGFNAGADSAYAVLVDRNEVALMKWREGGNLATLYWETSQHVFTNVTVRLALRKTESGLDINVRVDDKGTGAALYGKSFTDGPGQDAPVPAPDPHGMGIWTPDDGAAYTNFTYAAVGVWQIIPTNPPPLEMRLDNLEYDVYELGISNSVLLSWPVHMPGEYIVLGADAVEGPYAPVPEPIIERFGSLSVSVPTTVQQRFFRIVPGTQFMDGFSEPKQPYANRLPWDAHWNEANDEITVANGVLRLRRLGRTATAGLLLRPPEEVVVRDFAASLDILGFTASGDDWCAVYIMVNGVFRNPDWAQGNGAGLVFNAEVPGRVSSKISNGSQEISGQHFNIAEFPPPYRLEFSGVGSELRCRVVHLATKTTLSEPPTVPRTEFFEGWIGLFTTNPDTPETHELIVDNYSVTGTKP